MHQTLVYQSSPPKCSRSAAPFHSPTSCLASCKLITADIAGLIVVSILSFRTSSYHSILIALIEVVNSRVLKRESNIIGRQALACFGW